MQFRVEGNFGFQVGLEFGLVSEEPTSQLHTCLEGKAIEEIGDLLE